MIRKNLIIDFIKNNVFLVFIGLIILAGILIRLRFFITCKSLWFDECAVASNLVDKNYLDFFKPLDFYQVTPPLFLCVEKFFLNIFSVFDNVIVRDMGLRLFPFLCGVLSLPLFANLCRKISKNNYFTVFAVMILTFNHYTIQYSNMLKQYSCEMFFSILMMNIFYDLDLGSLSKKKIFLLSALLVSVVWFSPTSICFLGIGILILIIEMIRQKKFYIREFLILTVPCFLSLGIWYFSYFVPVYKSLSDFMYLYWSTIVPSFFNQYNFIPLFAVKTNIFLQIQNFDFLYFYKSLNTIQHINIFYAFGFLNLILLFFTKNYKLILYFLLSLAGVAWLSVTGRFPYESRTMLFMIPIFIIFYSVIFNYLKKSKLITFGLIYTFAIFVFCNIPKVDNDLIMQNIGIREFYSELQTYNPEMKNIMGTKSCYLCYGGKEEDLILDLDIWEDFDVDKFDNYINNLPKGDYYIFLPYNRLKQDYGPRLYDYIFTNDNIKIKNIIIGNILPKQNSSEEQPIEKFTAQINVK